MPSGTRALSPRPFCRCRVPKVPPPKYRKSPRAPPALDFSDFVLSFESSYKKFDLRTLKNLHPNNEDRC